jgi:hypothetical protein
MPRGKLFRAIHAEALKRGLDHDALREIFKERFGVHSMGQLTEPQIESLYRSWTGHKPRKREKPLPKRGYAHSPEIEIVSGEDLETLARAFALAGWGKATQEDFIRRQLGRASIRTRRDFWKVFSGVRAINRRNGVEKSLSPREGIGEDGFGGETGHRQTAG